MHIGNLFLETDSCEIMSIFTVNNDQRGRIVSIRLNYHPSKERIEVTALTW